MSCGGRLGWVGLGAVLTLLGGRAVAEEEGKVLEAEVLVPDGEEFVSHDGLTVRLPGAQGASVVVQPVPPMGWVFSVAYSPNGRTLASASSDGSVKFFVSGP